MRCKRWGSPTFCITAQDIAEFAERCAIDRVCVPSVCGAQFMEKPVLRPLRRLPQGCRDGTTEQEKGPDRASPAGKRPVADSTGPATIIERHGRPTEPACPLTRWVVPRIAWTAPLPLSIPIDRDANAAPPASKPPILALRTPRQPPATHLLLHVVLSLAVVFNGGSPSLHATFQDSAPCQKQDLQKIGHLTRQGILQMADAAGGFLSYTDSGRAPGHHKCQ